MPGHRLALLILFFAAAASMCWAQTAQSDIWDGVYTAEQAQRGKDAFEKSCSNCHNLDMKGGLRGPSLLGERFLRSWENGSVNTLFRKLRDTMPATYPETVTDETKLDILTYLLQANAFPAGSAELKLDPAALEDLQITAKGQSGVPNFALVEVVGCLARGPDKTWILTDTSEPAVTREEAPTQDALQRAAAQPLGTATFRLVSVAAFQPESLQGRKMAARGLLYREPDENRLNLTSLETAAESCR